LPGTTVLFESAPKAKDFLGAVKGVKIEDAGDGAEGFHKFRLVL
jgi:2',3'-cyclic-nucleotide 2'-phosphodiesterase/3'-nucleotidase